MSVYRRSARTSSATVGPAARGRFRRSSVLHSRRFDRLRARYCRSSSSEGCVSVVAGEVCKTRSSTRTLILVCRVCRVLRMSPVPSRESPNYLAGEQMREIAAKRSKEFRVEKSPATEYGGSLSRPRLSGPLGSPSALRHLTHYHKPSLPLKGMSQNKSPGKSLDSAGAPGRFAGNRRDQIHHHRQVHLSRHGHTNPQRRHGHPGSKQLRARF